ncbi:MAG: hypothetical protein Aurels2KO_53200 [Aureliella sp.]
MDLRSADARDEHADFVLETLRELNSDIDKVGDAAGDYPNGVISGDAWLTGAGYASHAQALTHHFADNQWLEHEANSSGLWAKATLAVCSHYHHMVGPAMNANADCCRRLGDVDRAVQMWSGVVKDFTFLLDGYDDDPDGPYEDDRVALESLREACVALQSAGNDTVDSLNLGELISKTDAILSRPAPNDDGG